MIVGSDDKSRQSEETTYAHLFPATDVSAFVIEQQPLVVCPGDQSSASRAERIDPTVCTEGMPELSVRLTGVDIVLSNT